MKRFYNKLVSLVRDDEGTEVVEWALAGGLIVAVGAAIFVAIGTGTSTGLTNVSTQTGKIVAVP